MKLSKKAVLYFLDYFTICYIATCYNMQYFQNDKMKTFIE